MPASPTFKIISLYTGLGGLDYGFEAAGFRTSVAVELDPIACDTLRLNRNWPVLEGNIHKISSAAILRAAGLDAGCVDVLVGGPPCQPFSKASYWKRGDSRRLGGTPRASTLNEYLRVLSDTRPKAFLLENVPGLAFSGKSEGLQYLLEGVHAINRKRGTKYRVSCNRLNAADFGVPQSRELIFLVGFRDGRKFATPPRTHGDSHTGNGPVSAPLTTAWDAIGDLDWANADEDLVVTGKWSDLLASIPEGHNYLWHTSRGGGTRLFGWAGTRYGEFLLKLAKNQPSWTIQAQPGPAIGPFHWRNRRLSVEELCRLQTLPKRLRFTCARTEPNASLETRCPRCWPRSWHVRFDWQLLERPQAGRSAFKLSVTRRGRPPAAEPSSSGTTEIPSPQGSAPGAPGDRKKDEVPSYDCAARTSCSGCTLVET